jgi:type II secretory pathway component PulF
MPKYTYTSKSFKGESHSGVMEAKSDRELALILRAQGEVLISANSSEFVEKKKKFNLFSFFGKVSLAEKIFFARNLKVMVVAGVSLPRALKILSQQAKSKKMTSALLGVSDKITEGKSFYEGLSNYPEIFPEIFLSMVKVGEESGTLEESLGVVVKQMERSYELQSKIKGAMMYPAVILCAMVLVGIAMLILVVPSLAKTFEELNVELPITTRFVIGLGNFFLSFWYLLPFIFLAMFIIMRVLIKTKTGKAAMDGLFLKLPLISPLVKKTNSAYTVRTLSSLMGAGVPIVRALEIVAGSLSNVYYKRAILDAADSVKKGSKLGDALKKYSNIYSGLVVQMIEIGEETGETSGILEKLADFFEEEVSNAAKNLSSIIEPILMLIIGGAVGFFAISMIQPIYGMMNAF